MLKGYEDLVRSNGQEDLVRTAVVESADHAEFTAPEVGALIAALERRLDSGDWGDTRPSALNELAGELDDTATARFIDGQDEMPVRYNRQPAPAPDATRQTG
jgi:hypothetical protein